MNPEMWNELKEEIRNSDLSMADADKIFGFMAEIERRTLPERVAEILEKAEHNNMYMTCGGLTGTTQIIAHALRTGDTREIEKWCGK